jgi:Arc/MetJ-type ribon-helix-helix transcriptional regulator
MRQVKRPSERCVRRNVSLPPKLDVEADALARKFAFATFSDYVQARMRKDLGLELVA